MACFHVAVKVCFNVLVSAAFKMQHASIQSYSYGEIVYAIKAEFS